VDDIDALIDGIGDSKPTPQKTIDPIDAAIDNVADASDETLSVNMLAGSKSDPERYAKAKKLTGFVGLTADIVERNLEEVEQKVKRRTAEGKINRAPVLRERATADREFTKLIMDDEVLPDVETALRTQGFKAASIQRRKAQDREIKERWDRLLSVKQSRSVVDVVTDPLKAAAAGSNIMAAGIVEFGRYNPVDIVFNKALGVFAPDVKAELDESRNQVQNQFNSGVEFWNEKKSFDIQDRIEAFNKAGISDAIGMLVTDPGLLLDQLAQSSPYLIPGAAAARGGTAAMLGYTSIIEAMDAANTARQEAIAAGATPDQQNSAAAIAALVTAPIAFLGNKLTGTAKIETDFLTKGTISNTMLSAMVREAVSGAAEEGGNQFGVNLGAILGYDDDRESTEGVGKAAAIGGVLEAVQGGGMRAISLASQKINGETEIAQDIMADAEVMQAAVEMVSQTKLLQRDEGSLRGYMQQVANDMGVETVDGETKVYLSPEALSQIANEIPNIEQDLQIAQEAGHDVAVNLGDLIVAMSKTGTSQEIIPAIRFSANQPTVAEAQINAQPEMQRMIDTANQIAAQEVENTKFQQESQAVYDDVLNQLVQANRFSRDVNAPYAKLHQAFYQTYAQRMGIGVGEFYERFGMKISDTANGGLEQANSNAKLDTPEFKTWFGDSKVVDSDGKPLVVYHGTGATFDVFDANKIGSINGRSEGPGFYFTTNKTVAEMYSKRGDAGALLEVYLNIAKPLRYDAPPFSGKKLQALLVEIARQELAQDTELEDWRDGYLANYVYTPEFKTLEAAAKEATKLFDGSETALDQMGGIIGGGVPADYLNAAVRKALGYDGYISQGFGNIGDAENTIYVAMDSTQIKSATDNSGAFDPNNPNIYMQSPIFYSQLRTQLEAAKIDNVPASQWKAWLIGNAPKLGIKKAEIEATGITDWLDLQDGKIGKSFVLEFLDGNGVQVEDVLLFDRDGAIELDEPAFYEQSEGEDMRWRVYGYEATLDDVYDTEAEAKARTDEINANQPAGESKYSQYTVPGGENYKELLLTLPEKVKARPKMSAVQLDDGSYQVFFSETERFVGNPVSASGYVDAVEKAWARYAKENPSKIGNYKSSHFDKPNILAHVRFDERTDADGNRVLFVQEIQSDWGQEGKKKGFVERYKPEDVSTLEPDAPEANQPDLFWYFRVPGNVLQIPKSRYETEAAALNYVLTEKQTISGATAPKAPFVTDTKAWVSLAIKRILRLAVDNGFDKVAFINGQQAADLYDLSKEIGYLNLNKLDDGTYNIEGYRSADALDPVLDKKFNKLSDLENIVGKEVAKKLIDELGDGQVAELRGEQLATGGYGMKNFYDQIVPQVANDVLKKVGGGKVDTVNLANKESDFDFIELGDATEAELEQLRGDGIILPQSGFTITPEMRKTIVKGLPLFQNDNAPRGTFNPDTRTIALLNASDLSTFLHESSHGFLEILTELASLPDASSDILADTQKVMDWFGTDLMTWNGMTLDQRRDFHEKWAEASERYFFEGKAPTIELQAIFQKFRDWVKSVYKTLEDLVRLRPGAAELTDEIRQVMDRLYATDEAIAAAQETRGLLPLFVTQEESGLNDDDWSDYQANSQAATQDAIDEMNVRSLRDMKWMRRARDKYIRNLQKDAEELRRETTMEARRNVLSEPIYQAWTFLTAREWGKVSKAKVSKSLDPVNDSLLIAIAKLGGVDMTEADKDFGFDPLDMKIKPVFGKPVFRKSGGKSFDAMAELLAEYGYLSLDENGRHDVRDLEDYLFDEIRGVPHYSFAHEFAKDDRQDAVDLVLQLPAGRLNLDMVKAMLGDRWNEVGRKLGWMVASDGIDPDIVAEQYRNPEGGEAFLSGMDMIEKLIQAVPPSQAIQAETDRLMLERYGDINSPEALESAADEALHNEAMLKMSATELKALLKINTPVRQLEKAAKDSAIQVLSRTLVKELNPNKYASAAARAAREADKAIVKKDIDTAAQQKRMHALNLSLTKEAYAAKAEVTKALSDMRKLRKSDKDMAKTHDINLIDAARSIANAFGINGAMANPAEALAAMEKIKHYNSEVYDQLLPVVQAAAFNAKSYRDLTLEDFRGLSATIKQLMHQARRSKQITVDGRKVDLMSAREALIERMQELGIKEDSPGEKQAVTDKERAWWNLQGMKNALRRMESWVDAKDGGDFGGVFRTYIYSGVRDGVDKYRTEKNRVLKEYIVELQKKDTLGHFNKAKIAAPELGYSFGSENGNGKQELLGAMLHVGNDSNKRKLLLGRGWGKLVENPDGTRTLDSAQWDNFMRRMFAENVITKADMDFLQFTWDLMESIKPDAQKAHFELYGYYFDEITADPIQTPWGEYKGGYAPAKADTELVQDAAIRQGANEIENDFNYMMPSTGNGFTKGRVEYNRPLVMDLRLVAQHIDSALRFTYIQPAINDTLKLVKDREVSETLRKFDQTALDALIMPWLQRTAQQIRTTPFAGRYDGKALQRFFTGLRRRTGMSIMMANLVNALQQTTGLSLAAVKVKPRYLKASLAKWTSSPNAMSNAVAELSPWMRERLDSDIFEMQQAMDNILLGANQYDKFKDFVTRNAYFMQRAFQNSVDLIAWQAAFEEAQEGGMDVDQAVKRADFIVRETQSSLAPEDVSKFETGSAFLQLFTQFYNYFNMQANLLGTEFTKTLREQGVRKGSGRLLYLYVFGFAIPALMADAIVRTFGWDWDDEDDDGYLDEFNSWFFGAQFRTATAMFPVFGPTINAFVNRFNKLPYDDRISTSPAVSMVDQAIGAPVSTYKAVFDDGSWKRAIRDNLTLISLTTGVPVLPLSRPLGYAADMAQDKVQPSNPVDLARGLVTGKGREEERTR